MKSLRGSLALLATLLVVVVCVATGLIVWQLAAFNRAQSERQLVDTARAMSLAVDGQLQAYAGLLQALQGSDSLTRDDWATFDARARRVLAGPDAWIVVGDREGRQLVNTRLPRGARLPTGPVNTAMWPALDRGEMRVCNLAHGYIERNIVCVDAPVMRQGRAVYHVSVVFRPQLLQRFTNTHVFSSSAFLSILDRDGVVIWRNRSPDRFVGRLATEDLRAAIKLRAQGAKESVSLEGVPTLLGFSRSPQSGWTFIVGSKRSDINRGGQRALVVGVAAAIVMVLLAAAGGILVGRRITWAVERLSTASEHIRAGERLRLKPSGIREIDQVGAALEAAIAERAASQERFNLAQEVGGIGAWEWDMTRDEGHVSETYKEMHGLTDVRGPLRIGQVLSVIHPEDLPGYQSRLAAAKQRREPSTNDYRVVLPDGSIRWISAKGRPIFDENGDLTGGIGVVMDMTDRKEGEERLRLLMREVDHRANNLMSVVQGAVTLSRADSADELRAIILGRLEALGRAHQLLAASRWEGADLAQLARDEMLPFNLGDDQRASIDGPSVALSPAAAQAVAMALHELATNAAKHGALSAPGGRVRIRWRTAAGRLCIEWEESGGPPVRAPSRRGFGTTVLERALGGALRGVSEIIWRPEGLVCHLELPLDAADDVATA